MPIARTLLGVVCAAALLISGCSDSSKNRHIDIKNIFSVKSTFGPQFKVVTSGPTGIDPRVLAPQKLPPGIAFDPADCEKYAAGPALRPGLKGNMAAVAAEGENNRFVAVAVETSERVSLDRTASEKCKHVTITGNNLKGVVEVVDTPHIDAAQTVGTHRSLEATIGGQTRSGELYNYTAYLGNYVVLVAANPLAVPNQPPAAVNVDRARKLLTDAVAAVRR